jgi:hypothetical protein
MADRITLREYDTVLEAKSAEKTLLEAGLGSDIVKRAGKRISVPPSYEGQAHALLVAAAALDDATSVPTAADQSASVGDQVTSAASSTASTVGQAASTAADTAQQAASTVADTAQQAASTVADTAQQAASTVADTAQQVASAAVDTVQDATSAVTSQVGKAAGAAAETVQSLAQTVRQQGATPDAPAIQRQAAQTTANVLDKTSQYLRQGDLKVVLEDLRGVIRRNPVPSLLVGLGLGYLVRGTFFPSSGGSSQSSQTQPSAQPAAPPTPMAPAYPVGTTAAVDTAYTTDVLADATLPDVIAPATTLGDATTLDATSPDDTLIVTEVSVLATEPPLDTVVADPLLDDPDAAILSDTDVLADADVISDLDTLGGTGAVSDLDTLGGTDVASDLDTLPLESGTTDLSDAPSFTTDEFATGSEGTIGGSSTSGTGSVFGDAVTQWDEHTRREGSAE